MNDLEKLKEKIELIKILQIEALELLTKIIEEKRS